MQKIYRQGDILLIPMKLKSLSRHSIEVDLPDHFEKWSGQYNKQKIGSSLNGKKKKELKDALMNFKINLAGKPEIDLILREGEHNHVLKEGYLFNYDIKIPPKKRLESVRPFDDIPVGGSNLSYNNG